MKLLDYIVANVPHSIFWKDCDGRFLGCNQNFLSDVGKSSVEELLGKTDYDLGFPREQADFWVRCDRQVMESGQPLLDIEEPMGRERTLVTSKVPLRDEHGNVSGLLGIYVDITERKRIERELTKAKDAAEAADRAKSDFLATMSHELRTPLTLILGPLEALLSRAAPLDGRTRADLERMHRNAARLYLLVNDVLDFTKIEAGKMPVDRAPIDPLRLIGAVVDDARPAAEGRGLALELRATAASASHALIDRRKLEKIVLNLLGNALKFTPQGGRVVVTAQARDGVLDLEVADTGPGIPREKLGLLFQRFQQLDSSSTRAFEGSGLGLALVRDLVTLLGGSIAVESELGQGSRFRVRLPLVLAATTNLEAVPEVIEEGESLSQRLGRLSTQFAPVEPPRAPCSQGPVARARVLFADDNADLRAHVAELLAGEFEVETVANGRLALEAAHRAPPDVILSDVMMPELDGLELLARVKADPALAHVPVVLLSARTGPEAIVSGLDGGADEYLCKPFGGKELLARMRAAVRLRRAHAELVAKNQALETAAAELRAAQAELIHTAKMAAVGTLIAGISHELNNPMSVILMNAQSLLERTPEDAPVRRSIGAIERNARRCGKRIQTLLDFSRKNAEGRQQVSARSILDQVLELSSAQARTRNVELVASATEPSGATVEVRVGEIEAALLNLVSNALDVTPPGGRVLLDARAGAPLAGRDGVVLSVSDSGPGIPVEVLPRIFEPFFTTKPVGKGTGLGLALARKFVEDEGGRIEVDSAVGRGTTMEVWLPAGRDRVAP